jgi:thiol-disulfide isomerase/thioredoxin
MSAETTSAAATPQALVSAGIDQADQLRSLGELQAAAQTLERGVQAAHAKPYEIEFATRLRLGMTLADVYLALNRVADACVFLSEEAAFADKVAQIMQATGTPQQKRSAMSGYLQIRDRSVQIGLLGKPAINFELNIWLVGDPVTLEELRSKVVLLEFWATWCKPCQEMFPKLTALYEQQAGNGLEIIALTRHYMAYKGPLEARNEELDLMRKTVYEHGVRFRVAVAEDERWQTRYGANGLPTVVLIDRRGIVQYAGPGGEDPVFQKVLGQCLSNTP